MADKVDLDALEGDWLEGRWPQRDALIAELRASRNVVDAVLRDATHAGGEYSDDCPICAALAELKVVQSLTEAESGA